MRFREISVKKYTPILSPEHLPTPADYTFPRSLKQPVVSFEKSRSEFSWRSSHPRAGGPPGNTDEIEKTDD